MKKEPKLSLDYAMYKMLQDSLDALPIGVTISDIEGKIIYTNTAEATMHGYAIEELIGKDARIFAPLQQWKRLKFEELYKIGAWKRESINIKKNGELFFVQLTSIAVKREKDVPIGIITVCEDITKQKKSEEMLKESDERYRSLFENAHDMIQSVAPDGHFIFVNPAWLKTMGYTWDELQKITILDILHPSCIPHCTQAFQKVMSGESLSNVEAIFVAKDGRLINVEGNVNARFIGGKVVASHGIFRDITEHKKSEEEIKKRVNELEEFYDMAVGRELRMKQLKEENEELNEELEKLKSSKNQ